MASQNFIQNFISWFQTKKTSDFEQQVQSITPILPKIKGTKLYYMIQRYQQEKKRIYV